MRAPSARGQLGRRECWWGGCTSFREAGSSVRRGLRGYFGNYTALVVFGYVFASKSLIGLA